MEHATVQSEGVTESWEPPLDFFAVLGLCYDPGAPPTAQEVGRAYRRAAMRFHPDRNPSDPVWAKRHFELVCRAYETLRNAETRSAYEAWLERSETAGGGRYTERPGTRELTSVRRQRRDRLRRELEARERRAHKRCRERRRMFAERLQTAQRYGTDRVSTSPEVALTHGSGAQSMESSDIGCSAYEFNLIYE
ncbi:hypothetical protein F1559_001941 [Cyanidiococcus yangmingshanensis]|uniref:J domain-containing protein n=1 Tax=Cyanidiococcus yangmingshanensis TaxID=2690220 RepID=A0A7J7IBT9_9RHOD|nr:hypothetical protein F1559_001941 [Cyanidiococcus yangmingshanensis]